MRVCSGCGQAKSRDQYYPKDLSKRPNGYCRPCTIAKSTAANGANPSRRANVRRYNESEKGNANQKRFDEKHPGKRKDYVERHYDNYPERLKAKRDRDREAMAAKYRADPEAAKRKTAEYLKQHPELKIAKDMRYRARKIGAVGRVTKADLLAIWERQVGRCAHCDIECHRVQVKGKPHGRQWSIDHIVPLSRGGSNWPSNLQGLCRSCNSAKKDRKQ